MTERENQIDGPTSELRGKLLDRQAQLAADLKYIAAPTSEASLPDSKPNGPFKGDLLTQAEALPGNEVAAQEVSALEVGRVVFNRDSGISYTVMSVGEGVRPGGPVVVMEGQDGFRFTTKASRLASILASKDGAWHY
jgi:hypothetical protein